MPDELAASVKTMVTNGLAVTIISETKYDGGHESAGETQRDTKVTPDLPHRHDDRTPAEKFIGKCKEAGMKIGELNGARLTYRPRGLERTYTFRFDAEGFCRLMDTLYEECGEDIDYYLEGAQSPDGLSNVLPFVGMMLDEYSFSTPESLHKVNIVDKLQEIYSSSTVSKYLSNQGGKKRNQLLHLIKKAVDKAAEMARKG